MDALNATGTEVYTDSAGWSLVYPRAMQLAQSSWAGSHPGSEVTIASFAQPAGAGPSDPDAVPVNSHGDFPPGAVAFRVITPERGSPSDRLEATFPVRLGTFAPADHPGRSAPSTLQRPIEANGQCFHAIAWIAADAPAPLRAALEQIISSLSFEPLHPGDELPSGFTVLEPAGRYPVGAFTAVRARGLPFYLVHSPGGFYGLGWNWPGSPEGYRSSCRHLVDDRRKEIYCPDCEGRWDRVGQVIIRPASVDRDDPLHLSDAKVAWDGHVILHPGTYQIALPPVPQRFWPEYRSGD
jgi:hypothetical protein